MRVALPPIKKLRIALRRTDEEKTIDARVRSPDNPVKRNLCTGYCILNNRYSIDDIRAFCAAARTGQFNEAAERLHLSASAFSRRIASIEDAVGGRVFDRSTRQVRLTSLGIALYQELAPLLSSLDGSFAQAARIARGETGSLVVAMVATVGYSVLPEVLDKFYSQHSGVFVSVKDGIAASIANLVEDRVAEFGIATHTAFGSALEVEHIGTYSFGLVGSSADPVFKAGHPVAWSDLSDKRVIGLNPTSSTRLQVDGELGALGIDLPWFMEVDQFSTMLSLIRNKAYCAVLPTLFDPTNEGLLSLPLVEPVMRRDLYFVKRRDKELTAQGATLAKLLRAVVEFSG